MREYKSLRETSTPITSVVVASFMHFLFAMYKQILLTFMNYKSCTHTLFANMHSIISTCLSFLCCLYYQMLCPHQYLQLKDTYIYCSIFPMFHNVAHALTFCMMPVFSPPQVFQSLANLKHLAYVRATPASTAA